VNVNIIKECVLDETGTRIVLRSGTYSNDLAYLEKLYAQACQDFPGLTREQVTVCHYAGQRFRNTFGIEFDVPIDVVVPPGYEQIGNVEFTLA
jgi:hypothetical protein